MCCDGHAGLLRQQEQQTRPLVCREQVQQEVQHLQAGVDSLFQAMKEPAKKVRSLPVVDAVCITRTLQSRDDGRNGRSGSSSAGRTDFRRSNQNDCDGRRHREIQGQGFKESEHVDS